MNIAVIGLGSMGKRRIRLIKEMYPDFFVIGIDSRKDRREEAEEKFGISCIESMVGIPDSVECAFICTSPLSHSSLITTCLNRNWNVFTELNLVSEDYDLNAGIASEKNLVLFLSSTFLYREEIRYLKSEIDQKRKWNYIYHTGQYLPDWHPWESFNDFFLGDKRTNGCRELLAIELPWLIDTFGEIESFQLLKDRITGLNIDYDDNFIINLRHTNGNKGALIIDVVSPVAVRNLEVYSERRFYSWKGTPDSLLRYNHDNRRLEKVEFSGKVEHIEGYSSLIIENAYRNEIEEFFEAINNGKEPSYSFEQDKKIIDLIDRMGA